VILQSNRLADYLKATPVVDWDDARVQRRTTDIVGDAATDVDRAKRLFEWVRDTIPHSKDIDSDLVSCSASDVLEKGTGICYAKSHLLAAMCRAVGIPTGFCYQVARVSPTESKTALHAFNAVYLPSIGKWVRIDARGNTGDIDAQFDVDHEKLAFPVDPAKGELFIYHMVFVDPVPQVVDVLTRYESRRDLWQHLPPAIDDALLCTEDRAFNTAYRL
jgi:transglutaminase-like putative cysteine protease